MDNPYWYLYGFIAGHISAYIVIYQNFWLGVLSIACFGLGGVIYEILEIQNE